MIEPLTHTALDGTAHGFFTRQGGVSTGLYESLNTGLGSDDARARVLENRDRVRLHLGASALATAYQTHSTVTGFIDAPQEAIKADALVTTTAASPLAHWPPIARRFCWLTHKTALSVPRIAAGAARLTAYWPASPQPCAKMAAHISLPLSARAFQKKLMRSALNSLPALRAIMPMTSIYSRRPRKAAIICLTCRLLCSGNWRASILRRIS